MRKSCPEPIKQKRGKKQPVRPPVRVRPKAGRSAIVKSQTVGVESKKQEDKTSKEQSNRSLSPGVEKTEDDRQSRTEAMEHKSATWTDEEVESSQHAKRTSTMPDEKANDISQPPQTIQRKPFRPRSNPPPAPAVIKRKPLPGDSPLHPRFAYASGARQLQRKPKSKRKSTFFRKVFSFRTRKPDSQKAIPDRTHRQYIDEESSTGDSGYIYIEGRNTPVRLSQLSFASEPFPPAGWEFAQRLRDNQPPYRDDPAHPYEIEYPRANDFSDKVPRQRSPMLMPSRNVSTESLQTYYSAQYSVPEGRIHSSIPESVLRSQSPLGPYFPSLSRRLSKGKRRARPASLSSAPELLSAARRPRASSQPIRHWFPIDELWLNASS